MAKEIVEEADLIYETDFWRVIVAIDQTYLGRCVIVLKRDCGDLSEVSHEEMLDFLDNVVVKTEKALRKAFGATLFNWGCLMNNAFQEENPKPQVHWHLRPRYQTAPIVLGEAFTDPNFGHHYERGVERKVTPEVKAEIIKKFRENLG